MRDVRHHFGGSGLHFRAILGVWAGSGSKVRLGRSFGRLLGGSWSRLGAVLGPKMDPVTSKLPPKPNPIGVLVCLDASLERPRSVPGALPALYTKKDEKLRQFWWPGT